MGGAVDRRVDAPGGPTVDLNAETGVDELLRRARERLDRMSPRQAQAAAAGDGLIVDIRSEVQRLARGLVPGAVFVPRNVLEWRADPACPHRDERLVAVGGPPILMCAQGYPSSLAAANLVTMGVTGATDTIGGFEAWVAGGLPVVPAPPA